VSRTSQLCPRCQAAVSPPPAGPPSFPFCSPRCKLVDLSKWLSGSYRIPGEPIDPMAPSADRDDGSTPSA
jgi:endogenous inhibitor of DNA gyrase (YacG/DUF329 family)